ncbi:MAG: tetratricopeptide repeat protein [Caldilineaceae bacterium]|nr:tetratricopeptide repeat protein [Caldilineaceae bacterium]
MIEQLTETVATGSISQTVEQLNQQATTLQFSDPALARHLAEQALTLARYSQQDPLATPHIGQSLTILSRCCIEIADYNAAIDYGLQAIALGEQLSNARFLPPVLGLLGYAYTRKGQYVDGLRYFIRQQQISKEQHDRRHEASAYVGRGIVYSFSGDQEKAIDALQTSFQIFQEVGDQFGQATALTNLSNAYEMHGDYRASLAHAFQALAIIETAGLKGVILHLIYSNLGVAYLQLENFSLARDYLDKALLLARSEQDPYVEMLVHLELGRLHKTQTDYPTAIEHLESAIAAAKVQGQRMFEYEAHEALAQVYQATGELGQVIEHLQEFYTIRDSVLNLQNKTRLGAIELEQELENMRREAALSKRLATELEQQVEERTAALRASLDRETHLAQELERALVHEAELQRLKTHIINTASHEFRTPLSIISLSLEMLCDRADQLSPQKRLHYRNRVREQILYLTDMLQDIFAINTSNEIEPNYVTYAFHQFCQQIEQILFRELQQTSGLSFIYAHHSALLTTDIQIIKRILFNLVVNAIKFSDADAPIQVYFAHNGEELVIRVVDQGIGIPAAEQSKIFDLFYRGSNVDTRRGLGLGLGIVQKLVLMLNGHVKAESPGLNQGSTFSVYVPTKHPHSSRILLG